MKIKKGTSAVANTAPIKISLKVLFTFYYSVHGLKRFSKYSISLNLPIPGFSTK